MNSRAFVLLLGAAACLRAAERIDVAVERLADGRFNRIDPQTVLASGDRVRFRFNSSVAGWLSVYYAGSGGQADWLLPSRLVTKDTPFLVPAEPASYTIEGPPGLDVLYWIVSPKQVPLESLVPSGARRQVPHTLVPRCRSGKEPEAAALACLDDRAGPVRLRARELKIDSGSSGTGIQPADRNIGVIVYEFRLAHR